ncbi:hypothetical protein HanHA89_Chr05g0209141 [Helianthus annuus]|nr:hypothetical protein HanHA89_Chr05g0209141 [Helianthus annuus]
MNTGVRLRIEPPSVGLSPSLPNIHSNMTQVGIELESPLENPSLLPLGHKWGDRGIDPELESPLENPSLLPYGFVNMIYN